MSLSITIRNAKVRAQAAHEEAGDRYGPFPYVYHLLAVLSVGFEFGITDEDVLVSCLLHDVIEDTAMTREDVEAEFGPRVAALVDAVSDPPGYKKRKDRKAAVYPRIRAVPGAVTVKLADRVANVRSCWNEAQNSSRSLLGMYKKEYGKFRKELRGDPAPIDAVMWEELDRLLAWAP